MAHMLFIHDDGGRAAAGFKGAAGDCVTRSVAIATGIPYSDVYAALAECNERARRTKKRGTSAKGKRSARNGVYTRNPAFKRYMASIGWKWTPTMLIGSGCKVHLVAGELPMGRLVVSTAKHYTAVIDGVVHDTFDPQQKTYWYENGETVKVTERCVYGYWSKDGSAA